MNPNKKTRVGELGKRCAGMAYCYGMMMRMMDMAMMPMPTMPCASAPVVFR